jgi:L-threonylcarbamoyladenylate synthase
VRRAALGSDDARCLRECLQGGGVAVFPSDTVYGLGCDPEQPAAVERLYRLKGRRPDRPAAVMFFALAAALAALPELAARERSAIRALLPGPVTLLLGNPERRFSLACAGDPGTLGLRVPGLAGPLQALAALELGLLQSSANLSGGAEAARLADVPRELLDGADLVLDGGKLPGVASTVIDLREHQRTGAWSVLREGALPIEAVRRALA